MKNGRKRCYEQDDFPLKTCGKYGLQLFSFPVPIKTWSYHLTIVHIRERHRSIKHLFT